MKPFRNTHRVPEGGLRIGLTLTLVLALAFGILAAPLAADAPPPVRVPRIGFLGAGSPAAYATPIAAFRQGLRDLGYVEGQNVGIELRWAEGRVERLPALAAELVRLEVDVILTHAAGILAAKQATTTIPIVMALSGDPVGSGLVANLARPGGNITGLSLLDPELGGKRLELLREVAPRVSRVAVLSTSGYPLNAGYWRETEAAARALGVTLQSYEVRETKELDGAFTAMTKARAEALLVQPHPLGGTHERRIVDLAAQSRLPAVYGDRGSVEAGGSWPMG